MLVMESGSSRDATEMKFSHLLHVKYYNKGGQGAMVKCCTGMMVTTKAHTK